MKSKVLTHILCTSLAAACCMFAVSCEKAAESDGTTDKTDDSDDDMEEKIGMVFVADSPEPFSQSIPGSTIAVLWSENDALSIFDKTGNNRFTITSGAGQNEGNFAGEAYEAAEYLALYPYSEDAVYSDGYIFSSLPAEQTAIAGSFDTMLNPAAGSSTDNELSLRNMAGLIALSVGNIPDGKTVQSVTFEAEKNLTGDYKIDIATFSAAEGISGSASGLTVRAPEDEPLAEGNTYYAVVLPGTYYSLRYTVILDDGTSYSQTYRETVTVGAGSISPVALSAAQKTEGLYARYIGGEEISIGDRTYSQEKNGNAVLISENTVLDKVPASGIYFIEPDVTLSCNPANTFLSLVIIGNAPDKKSKVELGHNLQYNGSPDGFICLYNLDIKTNGFMPQAYGDGAYGYIGFIDCDIETSTDNTGAAALLLSKTNINRDHDEFVLDGCNIHIQPGAKRFLLSNSANISSDSGEDFKKIVFRNNIFWSDETANTSFKFFNEFAGIEEFIFERNTIVNLFSFNLSGLFSYRYIHKISIEDNLYWNPENVLQYLGFFYPQDSGPAGSVHPSNPTEGSCRHNLLYQGNCGQNTAVFVNGWTAVNIAGWTAHEDFTGTDENPLSVPDFTNGVVTPSDQYSGYGAQM